MRKLRPGKKRDPPKGLTAKPELGTGLLPPQDQLREARGVGEGSARLGLLWQGHSVLIGNGCRRAVLEVYGSESEPHREDSGCSVTSDIGSGTRVVTDAVCVSPP